jgi:hypothetical protein
MRPRSREAVRWISRWLLAALLLFAAASAHAQTARPPLTNNDFSLDLVTGPVLGAGRIIGLGGAYTALSTGIEGAPWNPAAYASRNAWGTSWFGWDVTASIVPTMLRHSDFENNGRAGFTYGDFVFGTVGLGLRFGELGLGGLLNLHSYKLTKPGSSTAAADLSLAIANYGGGYSFADGQFVLGLGMRTALLAITDTSSGNSLVDFAGTSPELGGLLAPADRQWRIGLAARLPVDSGTSSKVVAAGLTLPRQIRLPWEVQAGFAFQLGPRPLNRKWVNPRAVEKRLRDAMLARRRAREREQLEHEQLAQRMAQSQDRTPPELAELQPGARAPVVSQDVPHDPEFWAQERTRRPDEERALSAEVADLERERDAAVRALSRRYILLSSEAILVGPTAHGVGLESFLSQQRQVSGQHVSVGIRVGAEGEPIASWVQMRVGTYFEPSRFAGINYRVHATLGTDVRLFTWDLFGLLDEFTLSVGAVADVAERYLNAGVGVGLWH